MKVTISSIGVTRSDIEVSRNNKKSHLTISRENLCVHDMANGKKMLAIITNDGQHLVTLLKLAKFFACKPLEVLDFYNSYTIEISVSVHDGKTIFKVL